MKSSPNEHLKKSVMPDYPLGCKRVLLSNDYYPALLKPHVNLITSPISTVNDSGIFTADGNFYPSDVMIFSTGFEATKFLSPVNIVGRGERHLWSLQKGQLRTRPSASIPDDVPNAYLGMMVAGFPNMWILYGPNTNLGHNSIIFMIECNLTDSILLAIHVHCVQGSDNPPFTLTGQANYIAQCIQHVLSHKSKTIEVTQQAMDAYNNEVDQIMKRLVFTAGCHSWYQNEEGRIINNCAYSTVWYWWLTLKPKLAHFILHG